MIELDVDGLFNVRADDAASPWLVRSGAPDDLTARGAARLRAIGVTEIVDLREASERRPSRHGIPAVAVPLYGAAPTASCARATTRPVRSLPAVQCTSAAPRASAIAATAAASAAPRSRSSAS